MYTIYKLDSTSSGLKFHFPSNVKFNWNVNQMLFELGAHNVNFVYYAKTRMEMTLYFELWIK